MFRTPKGSFTFTADHSGRLYLSNVFPGQWVDAYGRMANTAVLEESAAGEFAVLVVRWRADPAQGLSELAQRPGPAARLAEQELQRLRNPVVIPEGWKYLPSLGDAGVFSRVDIPGAAVIRCQCDNDAMILQKSVEAPFAPDTRVRWSWKVESLPSVRAEDSLTTHDYLSLAVEFDNGQDLTYLWSAALEPERSFRCPIASWSQRETHIVIRSGPRGPRPMDQGRARPLAGLSKCDRSSSCPNSRRLANRRQHFPARPRALRVSRHRTGRGIGS